MYQTLYIFVGTGRLATVKATSAMYILIFQCYEVFLGRGFDADLNVFCAMECVCVCVFGTQSLQRSCTCIWVTRFMFFLCLRAVHWRHVVRHMYIMPVRDIAYRTFDDTCVSRVCQ